MRRKWPLILLGIAGALTIVYLLGPAPPNAQYNDELPPVPSDPAALDNYIRTQESVHRLKPDNEARIVWANDSLKQKTPYAIVYLHGFSASQGEGEPVHRNIAKKFGCNLYLSRLAEHGIDTTDAMIDLTPEKYWESAKEAYQIAKQLGNKVIVMGTSTGGTLALMLAARYPEIAGLVLYSPNIEINDPNAWLLNNHWGLNIARMVKNSNYIVAEELGPEHKKYWTTQYRLEAAVTLQELIETTMDQNTFKRVRQPALTLYYYKDEVHQDSTVKVSAIRRMVDELGTPAAQKRAIAVPNAGNHVIGSPIRSNDIVTVEKETEVFLREVLKLQ